MHQQVVRLQQQHAEYVPHGHISSYLQRSLGQKRDYTGKSRSPDQAAHRVRQTGDVDHAMQDAKHDKKHRQQGNAIGRDARQLGQHNASRKRREAS